MEQQSIYGIVFSEDRKNILFVLRRDLPVWVLPGGGLDENESPEEGVVREIQEETGFRVQIVRKIADYFPVNKMTKRTHLFECSIIDGSSCSGEESKEVSFFSIQALPKRLPPPFSGWIMDALENREEIIQKPIEGVTYTVLVKLLCLHPILVFRYFLTKIGIRFNDRR